MKARNIGSAKGAFYHLNNIAEIRKYIDADTNYRNVDSFVCQFKIGFLQFAFVGFT